MSRVAVARLLLLTLCLGVAACRTLAPVAKPAPSPWTASQLLDQQRAQAAQRTGLRARARSDLRGASGEHFTRQLLLLQKPDRLRVEVLGLFGQRLRALSSDGVRTEFYQHGDREISSAPQALAELEVVLGLPLGFEDAVALLLAAPELPATEAEPALERDPQSGDMRLRFPDRSLRFDAEGRLRAVHFRPAPDAQDRLRVRYDDWRTLPGGGRFPFLQRFDFPSQSLRLLLTLVEVELNPDAAAHLFRLRPARRDGLSSDAEGERR